MFSLGEFLSLRVFYPQVDHLTLVLLIYICWVISIVKYFILLIYSIILCYSWTHILFKCADFPQRSWLEETLEGFPTKAFIHSLVLVWI
jgi:hypothetical protein